MRETKKYEVIYLNDQGDEESIFIESNYVIIDGNGYLNVELNKVSHNEVLAIFKEWKRIIEVKE